MRGLQELGDHGVGRRPHQVTQADDAHQSALVVKHGQGVDRLSASQSLAYPIKALVGCQVRTGGDVLGAHSSPDRAMRVPQDLSGELALGWGKTVKQAGSYRRR